MTRINAFARWGVIVPLGMVALIVAVTEPMVWRLPQAAPSLSCSAPSQVSQSRPCGFQSTIAEAR